MTIYFRIGIGFVQRVISATSPSLLTKMLPVTDIAKVFALMSAIEGLCPLISPVLYNSLYRITLFTFPASIYVLSIGVTFICIIFTR